LKPKLVLIVLKNSARTSERTLHFIITTINLLTLFEKIISVYSENHTKPTNKNAAPLIGKVNGTNGTYNYLSAL
jgi:hypothetical protein